MSDTTSMRLARGFDPREQPADGGQSDPGGEMPRGEMDRGDGDRGEVPMSGGFPNRIVAMLAGADAGGDAMGGGTADGMGGMGGMGGMPASEMPAGRMDAGDAGGMTGGMAGGMGDMGGASGEMPVGRMDGGMQSGGLGAGGATGPGADGMPSGSMSGRTDGRTRDSMSDRAAPSGTVGDVTIGGEWRLTLSSISLGSGR